MKSSQLYFNRRISRAIIATRAAIYRGNRAHSDRVRKAWIDEAERELAVANYYVGLLTADFRRMP